MRSAGLLVLGAAAAAAAPQEWIIHSQNRAFQPAVTTIRLGDSVTFVFETARRIVETVRDSCDQSKRGLDTGTQAVNATLTFKPSVTGTFYFTSASKGASDCNDGMKGILDRTASRRVLALAAATLSLAATASAAPQRWTIHSNLQSFQPKVTTILSGDTVTFVMDGTHQIYQTANSTSCDYNGGFDTGLRESNSLVNMTFTRPGTYFFSSSYSVNCLAGQRGTLIVQSLAGSTNPTSTSRTPTVSATAAAEGDGSSRGTGQNSDTTSTSTFLGFSPLAKSTQVIQNGAHAQARVAGQSAFAASAAVAVASALMSLFL
nr:hypothetical protein HK105_005498 [Polyrhizophydium stewartii]